MTQHDASQSVAIEPYAVRGNATIYRGNSLTVLTGLPANSIGACCTDPPYELAFMGRKWDNTGIAYDVDLWREVFRVLKPGAYLCAFGGTRTYHRMAVAIEDAGFVIRDSLHWSYGTGFVKNHNISKSLDKNAGAARGKRRHAPRPETSGTIAGSSDTRPCIERSRETGYHEADDDTPITDLARQWDGYGTALKPSHEPIVLAQKPLDGTYAANVEKWGVGGLNIDKCRIVGAGGKRWQKPVDGIRTTDEGADRGALVDNEAVRWPPNQILTHSLFCTPAGCDPTCPVGELDKQSGKHKGGSAVRADIASATGDHGVYGHYDRIASAAKKDFGGASRFFPILDWSDEDFWWFRYVSKPGKREKNAGTIDATTGEGGNPHVTVKPIAVMAWLLDLALPQGETVLDPFAGSFTTLCAARQRGYPSIGIDLDETHCATGALRLEANTVKGWR